jgi:hypothetical protein
VDCGLWIVDCGLWIVDCGLWIVDCGLWIVDCGLSNMKKLFNGDREGKYLYFSRINNNTSLLKQFPYSRLLPTLFKGYKPSYNKLLIN